MAFDGKIAGREKAISLVILTIAALFLRRPDQFLHPYIWVEDGRDIIKAFADRGWHILIEPISGYHIITTKLISYAAYKTSVMYAPEIELVLVTLLTCGVVLAIGFSPTTLRCPILCALAPLVVPTGPEVFATGSYGFWWTGLLLLLVPLWRDEKHFLKMFFLIFGGFSSPLVFPVTVILLIKLAWDRGLNQYITAGTALAISTFQFGTLVSLSAFGAAPAISIKLFQMSIDKLAGSFLIGPLTHNNAYFTGVGFAILAAMTLLTWLVREKLDRNFFILVALYALCCATISMRGPVQDYFAFVAARYFFYPFTLLIWIGIWVGSLSAFPVRGVLTAAFGVALVASGVRLSSRAEYLPWRAYIAECAKTNGPYEMPIQYDGLISEAWKLQITGAQCRAII